MNHHPEGTYHDIVGQDIIKKDKEAAENKRIKDNRPKEGKIFKKIMLYY